MKMDLTTKQILDNIGYEFAKSAYECDCTELYDHLKSKLYILVETGKISDEYYAKLMDAIGDLHNLLS